MCASSVPMTIYAFIFAGSAKPACPRVLFSALCQRTLSTTGVGGLVQWVDPTWLMGLQGSCLTPLQQGLCLAYWG